MPKNSVAVSLTFGIRVDPPTISTLSTSLTLMLAMAISRSRGARRRGNSAAARASKSARLITMRKSRSSWSPSIATWNC
eukprot:5339661-Pleurochrysis_carterae.AAC.1